MTGSAFDQTASASLADLRAQGLLKLERVLSCPQRAQVRAHTADQIDQAIRAFAQAGRELGIVT
ncbi:MAG: hypothetical protein ACLQO1_03640 [Steroidobacteraceae bacterium]